MLKTGYILSFRSDLIWFLGLPFVAIAVAFAAQAWMTAVVLGSVTLWVTFPHHFVTWVRTFGLTDDWRRFKDQLIIGPLVIMGMALVGMRWAPLTLASLVTFWDHQHSLMQQYGFARIYDFKARTGTPATGRWDLALNCVLYGNLLITAPLYTMIWVREAYRFELFPSVQAVQAIQAASWIGTGVFLCAYLVHVVRSVRAGYPLNPVKYIFIGASYFLWYFCSWQSTSFLVNGIAHRLMHGLQYIVIVYWYLRRKTDDAPEGASRVPMHLTRPSNLLAFVAIGLVYTIAYGFLNGNSVEELGFGVVSFMTPYKAIPEHGLPAMSYETGTEIFVLALTSSVALTHYYYDSFIWKVRDTKVQAGL